MRGSQVSIPTLFPISTKSTLHKIFHITDAQGKHVFAKIFPYLWGSNTSNFWTTIFHIKFDVYRSGNIKSLFVTIQVSRKVKTMFSRNRIDSFAKIFLLLRFRSKIHIPAISLYHSRSTKTTSAFFFS